MPVSERANHLTVDEAVRGSPLVDARAPEQGDPVQPQRVVDQRAGVDPIRREPANTEPKKRRGQPRQVASLGKEWEDCDRVAGYGLRAGETPAASMACDRNSRQSDLIPVRPFRAKRRRPAGVCCSPGGVHRSALIHGLNIK